MSEEETFCFSGSDGEEEKTMSSKELLSLLETAWLNEKFAPELLHHKIEIVDCMLDQLSAMAKNLEKSRKPNIRVSIHELELERIKFILSSYLRQRLQKVVLFIF
ncbi:hypothetical protein HELRODRAFT_73724 [Helobdella robusta]|uniref:GINS complex subunit 4 n=1 Tax=Helobdella robusta TaxID=6412 RepID=T1G1H7_HELRO|nr:hypothetical protein HELRODRAFT_73724 [Helobdella robusta]ESO09211.1 hypothetical protein HELRODRAFT_73724 [Helobdella robusta]